MDRFPPEAPRPGRPQPERPQPERCRIDRCRIERLRLDADGERLAAVAFAPAAPTGPTAVAMHGAGDSDSSRLLPLLGDLAARGCRALALDFSGHGASSGRLAELSLERRLRQASALIDRHAGGGELVLVGFSMSGQTVADLTARYGPRVRAVGLCAPAVYAREAWPVPFGAGFTGIIRRPGGWRDSAALSALRAFGGRSVLAVPGHDEVIPAEVTAAVGRALAARSDHTRLELPDAVHQLGRWFGEHPAQRRRFVAALLGGAGHPA
ncbi:alpha/beta hydrolase [Streptomyces sp. NRRL B-24484]|uniref:alpha/beta hydrolase n=1 Tax=Streptomyces sp. NRRL B-24484 TaxID=1463833 RepID=UPI001F25B716|nr:alpha/beta fold hydrolase [Streptomyces sp. NRRL B-24484]